MTTKTTLLSSTDVNAIMSNYGLDQLMDTLIARITEGFRSYTKTDIDIPIRSGFSYNNTFPGLIEWMPIYKKDEEVVIKVVGYHPKNPDSFRLPTILSSISSYDTQTGHLKGIADGVLLTALRTGAASAVASRLLAKENSSVVGLIGCGAQSITQLHGLSRVFNIKKLYIHDVDKATLDTFSERISMLNLKIEIVIAEIPEILLQSDIVCTGTSIEVGEGPLFKDLETLEHLHINAVGSDFPGKVEVPLDFLKQSLVCPDFLAQAKIEGECQRLKDVEIGPDLYQIVQNEDDYIDAKNGKTVFDSTGWALEDMIVMNLFLELAKVYSIGTDVSLENISKDAKNPYDFMRKAVLA